MRIISQTALKQFWEKHADSKSALSAWLTIASKAKWKSANEVKQAFPFVSILSNNRVVFNIKGNDYRLIVAFQFVAEIGYICFVGTHDEYNKVDANEIWMF